MTHFIYWAIQKYHLFDTGDFTGGFIVGVEILGFAIGDSPSHYTWDSWII